MRGEKKKVAEKLTGKRGSIAVFRDVASMLARDKAALHRKLGWYKSFDGFLESEKSALEDEGFFFYLVERASLGITVCI